jgi:hypothetical protein
MFTLVAVASMVAVVTGGAGATSTPTLAGAAGGTSTPTLAGGAGATSTLTLAPATVSHAATARKVSAAASRRGTLLKAANLSTRADVVRYLRAIGLDPRGLVIQRGARNYAGPNCPGAGWACTSTAHPVVQIAAIGGKNTYLCTSGSCAVVQTTGSAMATKTTRPLTAAAAPNKATCNKTSGLMQTCSITQTSATADNVAIVVERAKQASSVMESTSSVVSAEITQRADGSNSNQACVYQEITETLTPTNGKKGAPVITSLEGRQWVKINQDASSGNNTVQGAADPSATAACVSGPLTQTQTLTSRATGTAKITQNQNAADPGLLPNVSLEIKQNQNEYFEDAATTGENKAPFSQTNVLTAIAKTPAGPVFQTQSSPTGGISATVNQFSHGLSTASATQSETQCEDALTSGTLACGTTLDTLPYQLSQKQYGPVRKGPCPPSCSTQTGNSADTFTINQSSTQNNDTGQNQTNEVQGDCSTSGTCTVTQQTNVNGDQTNNSQTGSNVNIQISCPDGDSCTSSGGGASVSNTGVSASNVDVREFGVGGMRGTDGTGSIAVSGITGPVIGAFLYWNGPTNSTDPAANAAVTFNGTAVTGTNIGVASSNCWAFSNSQSYRADVTGMVSGNVPHSLAGFTTLPDVDINGVSLIVFYNDANSGNDRNVVLWNGNDSNIASPADLADWNETLTVSYLAGSGPAFLDFVVADGQVADDGALTLNGQATPLEPAGAIFEGASPVGNLSYVQPAPPGSLWDVRSFDMTSFLTPGANTLHLTSPLLSDCLSLVVVAANVPASAPVILAR